MNRRQQDCDYPPMPLSAPPCLIVAGRPTHRGGKYPTCRCTNTAEFGETPKYLLHFPSGKKAEVKRFERIGSSEYVLSLKAIGQRSLTVGSWFLPADFGIAATDSWVGIAERNMKPGRYRVEPLMAGLPGRFTEVTIRSRHGSRLAIVESEDYLPHYCSLTFRATAVGEAERSYTLTALFPGKLAPARAATAAAAFASLSFDGETETMVAATIKVVGMATVPLPVIGSLHCDDCHISGSTVFSDSTWRSVRDKVSRQVAKGFSPRKIAETTGLPVDAVFDLMKRTPGRNELRASGAAALSPLQRQTMVRVSEAAGSGVVGSSLGGDAQQSALAELRRTGLVVQLGGRAFSRRAYEEMAAGIHTLTMRSLPTTIADVADSLGLSMRVARALIRRLASEGRCELSGKTVTPGGISSLPDRNARPVDRSGTSRRDGDSVRRSGSRRTGGRRPGSGYRDGA